MDRYKRDRRSVIAESTRTAKLVQKRLEQDLKEELEQKAAADDRQRREQEERRTTQLRQLMDRYVDGIRSILDSVDVSDRERVDDLIDRLPEPYKSQLNPKMEEIASLLLDDVDEDL